MKPVTMAVLDLEKAFDSLSHDAIFESLEGLGLPCCLIHYLHYVYKFSKTQLSFKRENSKFIHPVKGVRQGDSLSPLLFLIVFNKVLKSLPDQVCFKFRELILNHLAYADDLGVLAESVKELQFLLQALSEALAGVGLRINLAKSFVLSSIKNRKISKMIYDSSANVFVHDYKLRVVEVDDEFRYLGARFTASGLVKLDMSNLHADLKVLLKAGMKPQQKLFCLNNFLIPKFYHGFIFSKLTAKSLNAVDISIRKVVRRILHLPHDLPKGCLPCEDG